MLLLAGVSYVVCVRREERVMDKASITFSRAFYHALFAGRFLEAFQPPPSPGENIASHRVLRCRLCRQAQRA